MRPVRSGALGPGVSSWMGQRIGEIHEEGCGGVAVADRVEEAVDGGGEGAQPHHVVVHEIDADLDADQVRGGVPHGTGGEGVGEGAAAEAQVDEFDACDGGGVGGPDAGGARGVGAVADRAAVVQPDPAARIRGGLDGGVGAQGEKFGGLVVREPDLDRLEAGGEVREGHGAGWAGSVLRRSGGHVDGDGVAVRHARAGGQAAVDEEVVQAVRAGRGAHIDPLGAQGVQFDGGRPGAQDQAYAGGLGLDHGQLRIGALGTGPGRQPVRQHTVLGALQLQGAAQEVGGDGGGDPVRVRGLCAVRRVRAVRGVCGVRGHGST